LSVFTRQEFFWQTRQKVSGLQAVFPLREFHTEQMLVLVRMQLSNQVDT